MVKQMTPQQYKEQRLKEFDELNIYELLNGRPEECHLYQEALPKIKSFLLKSIDGAYEKFREEEIERLEREKIPTDIHKNGGILNVKEKSYNKCLEDQISHLSQEIKKIKE